MTDFVRPFGKHVGMFPEMKIALFRDVAELINGHKLYSLSVSVRKEDFDSVLSDDVRKRLIGPYGMAFFCAALFVDDFPRRSLTFAAERTTFLVDTGFSFSEQLVASHKSIIDLQRVKGQAVFAGSLTFDTDDRIPALQAADVIAWAERRKEVDGLKGEFEPLDKIITTVKHSLDTNDFTSVSQMAMHAHIPLPKGGVEMFAKPITIGSRWLVVYPRSKISCGNMYA